MNDSSLHLIERSSSTLSLFKSLYENFTISFHPTHTEAILQNLNQLQMIENIIIFLCIAYRLPILGLQKSIKRQSIGRKVLQLKKKQKDILLTDI